MYYIVEFWSWRWRDHVRKFVNDWRKHVKYRLPKEVRGEIITEKWVNEFTYVILIKGSLLGLWIVRKLESLAEKHGVGISVFEGKRVFINEDYVDEKIRNAIEKIPPEHVHPIKKSLMTLRLPRKKEILETMRKT